MSGKCSLRKYEDIKFALKRAKFTTNTTGTVHLVNDVMPTKTLKQNPIETNNTAGSGTTLGSLVGLGSSVVSLTGQASTGSVGSLEIADVMGLTGVSATASVGTVDPKDQVMGLTGQSATVSVGAVNVTALANIDTGSNTSYSDISTGSNTSYSDVATGSNTSYNDVTGEAA